MKALRAIFGVVFMVAAIYAVFVLVPPYFSNYKFQDVIAEEARVNTYTAKSENDIRESIFQKAKELDIPVTQDQINVRREGQTVSISVDYTVHVNLPAYPLDLQFHPSSKNKSY
ncbi:MAG: DUF4845 domain-containing protein [Terriglobales bacterium]